jgi:hypothetical protein
MLEMVLQTPERFKGSWTPSRCARQKSQAEPSALAVCFEEDHGVAISQGRGSHAHAIRHGDHNREAAAST